jgi:hypothetical protein
MSNILLIRKPGDFVASAGSATGAESVIDAAEITGITSTNKKLAMGAIPPLSRTRA